jgi:hypothetical protein
VTGHASNPAVPCSRAGSSNPTSGVAAAAARASCATP